MGSTVNALGLVWVGTRTSAYSETIRFFRSTLELTLGLERAGFSRFDLPDGGVVEVFEASPQSYPHFTTGPVVGIEVGDFDSARSELERAGYPLLLPPGGARGQYRWQHFRGPDGLVFEIVDYPDRPPRGPPAGRLAIQRLGWMGISTPQFEEMSRFYCDVLGLTTVERTTDLIECSLPDGSSVEAFRRESPMDHAHFRTGLVPGLEVVDLDSASRLLRERGLEFLEINAPHGWAHFRAPDGNVYEIKQSAPG
jgi:catechol 2,3-dioxygenase-like lactoylglutathione lyase family enzyme